MYRTVGTNESKMNTETKGEKTKARVLETARRLVNEKGFCNTSINDVIRATGVKKGNLYFYFPSKEDLSLAILEEASREFVVFLSENLWGERPLARLANFLDAVFEKHRRANFTGG
jgi:TetR/AcrR family transcriptional regulator, transcriptional repressor for nem operon